jgi:hypothetical protein
MLPSELRWRAPVHGTHKASIKKIVPNIMLPLKQDSVVDIEAAHTGPCMLHCGALQVYCGVP